MEIKYDAKITYSMDKDHPDIKYVGDWTEDKIYTFEDVYIFEHGCYEAEDIEAYIKNDLKLIAGGGYNAKHIHNVSFEIKQE